MPVRTLVDTTAVKRIHPIADVASRYTELRRSGRALVGRCPLHADGKKPNFYVYEASDSFYCYSCSLAGDVIRLVELVEHLDFRAALAHLGAPECAPRARRERPARRSRPVRPLRSHDPEERAALAAAVELYSNRLLTDPEALAYVNARGLSRTTIETERVGYCAGEVLVTYLAWRRLPLAPAFRVGLLRPSSDGGGPREVFAGRIVMPEVRREEPIWLVGRSRVEPLPEDQPKYLGLPGRKPLLGWERVRGSASVVVVEGLFDYLTLRMWGVPVVALLGTHLRDDLIGALRRFPRKYLCLDADNAGRAATSRLQQELGPSAIPVHLPHDTKDVAELAPLPDGERLFAAALIAAARRRLSDESSPRNADPADKPEEDHIPCQ
jgi:DNA primase